MWRNRYTHIHMFFNIIKVSLDIMIERRKNMEIIREGSIEPFSIAGPDYSDCSSYCNMYSHCGTYCIIDIF